MVFSDLLFIFVFLPAFIVLYLIAGAIDRHAAATRGGGGRRMLARNVTLMLFSLVFYSWGEPVYIALMLVCVLINYLTGRGIAAARRRWSAKAWLIVGLVLDLAILASFKYLGFFAESLGSLGLEVKVPVIALPIGISFYTFQSISYLVDVYRRESPAIRSYFDLLLYIAMFPQLIAGPIVRYSTVADEIYNRSADAANIAEGSYRFIVGLAKKVIIANIMGEAADTFLADNLSTLSTAGAWIGIVAFTLQIYFDFSGYSDMAIGLGRCMGFHFCENFNHPYVSRSITEFWRRWHMSLGSFFRDYVYIPMGGNRRHQVVNILTVWFLTGMWHGASWNFIMWGVYFGLILMVEKRFILPAQKRIPAVLLHFYTMLIVTVGFGIFYFTDTASLGVLFKSLVGLTPHSAGILERSAIMGNFWIWIAALLLCMPVRSRLEQAAEWLGVRTGAPGRAVISLSRAVICVGLLVVCVALLVGATNNPFIYTRF